MKKTLLTILLSTAAYIGYAQYIHIDSAKYRVVKKDTINIRGVVYNALNQPIQGILIISKNKELVYDGYPIYAVTNAQGAFELKGALPTDTLNIWYYQQIPIINNSSRYLEIYLPQPPEKKPGSTAAAIVTAKRMVNKPPQPTFNVLTNATILDYYGIGIQVNAQFIGGQQAFTELIRKKIVYPEKAVKNNIEGDVEIGFTINRDGTLTDFKTIRGIGYGCEEAVINALKNSPKWKPGLLNSRVVISHSSITINFKLTDQ